jgi:hypothetical protein
MNAHDDPDHDAVEQLRAQSVDRKVLGDVWDRYRERLRRLVRLRLDRRLQGRVAPSDVLQEAFVDFQARAREYVRQPDMPFFLWLRFLTGQRLQLIHRHHLGTHGNARCTFANYPGGKGEARSLADQHGLDLYQRQFAPSIQLSQIPLGRKSGSVTARRPLSPNCWEDWCHGRGFSVRIGASTTAKAQAYGVDFYC